MNKNTKIICWNVNGIRAWYKKGCMDWFLSQKPDFFCIQETKAHRDQLTEEMLSPKGYTSHFDHSKGKKGYSGVAIYIKSDYEEKHNEKLEKIDYDIFVDTEGSGISPKQADQEGRFIALHYKKFVLINCYFPNGGGLPIRFTYKLAFYKAFLKYILNIKKQGKKVIFCGDVNAAHTEIDLARPKENKDNIGFLPVERAWIDKVIESGFVDTFRYKYPNKKDAYSWWDMKTSSRDRNVGWRIDYFFISEEIKDNLSAAKIHSDIFGSDHCPISIEISQ